MLCTVGMKVWLALVPMALVMARAAEAEACSPPLPGLSGTMPSEGQTYPANGHVLFHGEGITLDGVGVTVDGVAATLVPASPGGPLSRLAPLVARVEPAPLPGQEVVISGSFCSDDFGNCAPETLRYIAAEPDLEAPAVGAPVDVSYDVYDHRQTDAGVGACQGSDDTHYYIHVDSDLAGGEGTPVYWWITGTAPGAAEPSFERIVPVQGPSLDIAVALWDDVSGAPDVCIDVAITDAAGNMVAEVGSSCAACMYRADDDGQLRVEFVEEPSWTALDAYPGGSCTTGVDPDEPPPGNEGDMVVQSGCGCVTAGGRDAGWAWLVALSGLALGVLRRRR